MINRIQQLVGVISNIISRKEIVYVTEKSDWIIRRIGMDLSRYISNIAIRETPLGVRNKTLHFASIDMFYIALKHIKKLSHSNKILVTWFHVVDNDTRIQPIKKHIQHVSRWQTASRINAQKLIEIGIPENKIVIIPIGINLDDYPQRVEAASSELRQKLNVPKGHVVVGSFQKDGEGWGEGLSPKLVKGPDLFCDAVERLSKKFKVFVILTGPSRGYVKKRLDDTGIPYLHEFLTEPSDVSKFYHALDFYIVSSRVEGGPRAVMESMACGIPVISAKVGMAPDIIKHGENGFLVDVNDVDQIVHYAETILTQGVDSKFLAAGRKTAEKLDYQKLSLDYVKELYS